MKRIKQLIKNLIFLSTIDLKSKINPTISYNDLTIGREKVTL